MIDKPTFTDKVALICAQDAVTDIVMRAELMGLSLLGESVRIVQDATIKTMSTDGRRINTSPLWLKTNGSRGNVFDLLHEWLHIFLNHVDRCGDRNPGLWNIACDMVVVRMASEILTRPGDEWPPPQDGIIPAPWAATLSAEEIYDRMVGDPKLVPPSTPKRGDGEIHTGGDFDYAGAASYTPAQEEDFLQQFTSELAQAQLISELSSKQPLEKKYGDAVKSRLTEILRGTVPWHRLLRGDLISAVSQEFATWSPPRRKYYPDLILPSYRSTLEKKLLLGIDVSTSVGKDVMKMFIANAMPAAARAEETIVVTFDQVIREVFTTRRPQKILEGVKFLSGAHSHTDVRPVFDLIDKHRPSGYAILTDAYLVYPPKPYPKALWVVPKGVGTPPWGKTYVMERSW